MFSKKFDYNIEENRLSRLLKEKKSKGTDILDLTESNPTEAEFNYDNISILNSFSNPGVLKYSPNPKGLESARNAVLRYYKEKNISLDIENIFLTSSTSESYSYIFKLLCDPGDEILAPRPGYPLFSYIAEMESVKLKYYDFIYTENENWEIDFESLKDKLSERTKAILIVNPSNPTGNFLKPKEMNSLLSICRENKTALICDEVFLDYNIEKNSNEVSSMAGVNYELIFTLSGLSKICGLPQMKAGWIIISSPKNICAEAKIKLEIIFDTYLSIGTPVQHAMKNLMVGRGLIQAQIKKRITDNYSFLKSISSNNLKLLKTEGGWYSILRILKTIDEESLSYGLLKEKNVYIHPGYFYDFKSEGHIVVSLLTPADKFKEGVGRIIKFIETRG